VGNHLLLRHRRPVRPRQVQITQTGNFKALSTLSQKSATVAENGETTATVAEFSDIRTFLRQCGQALRRGTVHMSSMQQFALVQLFDQDSFSEPCKSAMFGGTAVAF